MAAMLAALLLVYYGSALFFAHAELVVIGSSLDDAIPLSPPWVAVYFLAYVSWAVGAVIILCQDKARALRFTAAFFIAAVICLAVYIFFPATMVRPEINGSGFFSEWLRFLYRIDEPLRLCPSLHVLINWFLWRGTIGCERIPKWYKYFIFVFFLLVCCSILFIKQHVLIDIPAALIVSEVAFFAASRIKIKEK